MRKGHETGLVWWGGKAEDGLAREEAMGSGLPLTATLQGKHHAYLVGIYLKIKCV